MVERDLNWINQRWFNMGIGTESMVELHFTCVGSEVCNIPVKCNALSGKKKIFKTNTQPLLLQGNKF
jgi:hypothetical protein